MPYPLEHLPPYFLTELGSNSESEKADAARRKVDIAIDLPEREISPIVEAMKAKPSNQNSSEKENQQTDK